MQSQQQHVALGSHAADPPRITTNPRGINDAVLGKPVTFTLEATGTEPLNYKWGHKIGDGNDVERILGANSSTLTIPKVKKSDEGSYCCIVSNYAGSETSECATLTVGEIYFINNLETRMIHMDEEVMVATTTHRYTL